MTSATAELQRVLSTPPPSFTGNAAAMGHAALQMLRDAGDPQFLFLRTILEQQQHVSQELLFHCITGTRHVLLARWSQCAPLFRAHVRDVLLVLGHQPNVPRTIRLAYFNAAASFWKRQWNDAAFDATAHKTNDGGKPMSPQEQAVVQQMQRHAMPQLATFKDLFHYVNTFLPSAKDAATTAESLSAGASFLSTLVGEFAGKSASPYRLPMEFHKRAHKAFETQGWLESSLQWSMTALSYVVAQTSMQESISCTVVQVTLDVLSWEFGTDAFDVSSSTTTRSLLRPPASWRSVILQPDFVKACFHLHSVVAQQQPNLAQALRHLLLLLTSLSGPVFGSQIERQGYCRLVLEGILGLMAMVPRQPESPAWMDCISLITRFIANFQLSTTMAADPNALQSLLQGMSQMGHELLQHQCQDCQTHHGDLESMEYREWREEAIQILLEGCVLLCSDPWLCCPGAETEKQSARAALSSTFSPLYVQFVQTRIRMAKMEERYLTQHEEELDEVREEIFAVDLEDEMSSLAHMGRLNMAEALKCLPVQGLRGVWDNAASVVTPDVAALLEEARLVILYVGHLLTDDNSGETPMIPDTILLVADANTAQGIAQVVQHLVQFAELQASKIAVQPSDPKLSPLLGKTLLWFLQRWCPAYVMPVGSGIEASSPILKVWATQESVQQVVSFCSTLCLHYHCYWPQEGQVQDSSARLLLSIAKRCKPMRMALLASPSFVQLLRLHCLTAGVRHSAAPQELEDTVKAKAGGGNIHLIRGYQRLPYTTKSRILTALMVACGDPESKPPLNECLQAIHDAFASLVDVLANKRADPDSVDAREMACLCAELYGGVARAGDMVTSERIPQFLTPALPHLSGLMVYYAQDLSICESLLRLFCDYSEQFIAILDGKACHVLFQSSAELLKSYSARHCQHRRVDAEEEQAYSDILCAIQLLIQLGAKDFIGGDGVDSSQVTDMIFFGLQHILPLMTQGLLQFPTLCAQYFSLVGFVMETYTDKLQSLPFELFDALLDSLLFGMSHHDPMVAKSSLQGLTGMIRDAKTLQTHLQHPGVMDKWMRRFLLEVVFSSTVWDRMESAGMLLLPLAAYDLPRFGGIVQQLSTEQRLTDAFQRLLHPDLIQKVMSSRGYAGRQNRIKFKKMFEEFCHEVHSFLVMK